MKNEEKVWSGLAGAYFLSFFVWDSRFNRTQFSLGQPRPEGGWVGGSATNLPPQASSLFISQEAELPPLGVVKNGPGLETLQDFACIS